MSSIWLKANTRSNFVKTAAPFNLANRSSTVGLGCLVHVIALMASGIYIQTQILSPFGTMTNEFNQWVGLHVYYIFNYTHLL